MAWTVRPSSALYSGKLLKRMAYTPETVGTGIGNSPSSLVCGIVQDPNPLLTRIDRLSATFADVRMWSGLICEGEVNDQTQDNTVFQQSGHFEWGMWLLELVGRARVGREEEEEEEDCQATHGLLSTRDSVL